MIVPAHPKEDVNASRTDKKKKVRKKEENRNSGHQAYPNGCYHRCPESMRTPCCPSALAPFTPTPNYPPPLQTMPHTKPHPSRPIPSPSALSASEDTSTLFLSSFAQPSEHGMTNLKPSSSTSTKRSGSRKQGQSYAVCGNETTAVTRSMISCTCAQDAECSRMEPAHALELRKLQPHTSYKADAWEFELLRTGLVVRFPSIPSGLRQGFSVGYPMPSHVQMPPNSTSLAVYEAEFGNIVNKELTKGHYIGPLPFSIIETLLGPFQSSPLSLIPKSGKPVSPSAELLIPHRDLISFP